MPSRLLISKKLARLLRVLSHYHRVRIIQELRDCELDVGSLQSALSVSQSLISQHLAALRSHQIVEVRREGRNVYYHLAQPELAFWLLEGANFIQSRVEEAEEVRSAIDEAREVWLEQPCDRAK